MEHRGDSGRSEEKGRLVRSPQEASQRPSTSRWEGCRVLLRHGDEVKREWVIDGQKDSVEELPQRKGKGMWRG